jgi:hypothetical protein
MQLILNFRNTVAIVAVVAGGYYCYQSVFADSDSRDVAKLIRSHRNADSMRQLILRRRILSVYTSSQDYATIVRALDHASPATQALAVKVLAAKSERGAAPKLLEMLSDPGRADPVKEALAEAVATFRLRDAIPRLVELTDNAEAPGVRGAAHNALRDLTGAGGQVKLSEAARQHWTLWLRTQQSIGGR